MSFVLDHVRAIDGRLDRLQLSGLSSVVHDWPQTVATEEVHDPAVSAQLNNLQELIKSLSTTSSARSSLCSAQQCVQILQEARLSDHCSTCHRKEADDEPDAASDYALEPSYEHELEWILISKATTQVYGLVLDSLIKQTIPLSDELWYWDDVLGSYQHLGLYSIQTSPLRLWDWSRTIYHEVRQREGPVTQGWKDFYRLVRSVVHERSIADIQRRVATPMTLIKAEVRQKKVQLERARITNANAIGYLLSNTFNNPHFRNADAQTTSANTASQMSSTWKITIARTIAVLNAVLGTASERNLSHEDFEGFVTDRVSKDPLEDCYQLFVRAQATNEALTILLKPTGVAARLQELLQDQIPVFTERSTAALRTGSRPSALVRYWLPATLLLVSSSTIYRYIVNRKAAILDSIRDFGSTILDFWSNWVIEPVRNVIRTIRHDAASEVSIMSKGSLEGDRASLERMVVDFAKDNQANGPLDQAAVEAIRASVREGDLTTVLRVYEKELQHPLRNSVTGSLVRALLIQGQKTKVDVEIAMGGIDSLLKSQELVFGFVGLTPGMLVTYIALRWLYNLPGSRRNARSGQKSARAYQILRNIDRIFTGSTQPNQDFLSFHEHGLLVCEAIALRGIAARTFPKQAFREFLQDFDDLIDVESGISRQLRVADRIRWAYARWL